MMKDLHGRRVLRAFSLIEVIIALFIIVVGFFAFFSVFATGSHHAVQTQNRAAANILAQSYMEEFRDHVYGTEAPKSWTQDEERPVRMVIKGRESELVFHKEISYFNGSFVGKAQGNSDKVTMEIKWREFAGGENVKGDNKSMTVEMPVWR